MQIFIYLLTFITFIGMKYLNLLPGFLNHWLLILPLSLALGYLGIWSEKGCHRRFEDNELHYENLDFMRYVCALIIVIMHLRPYVDEIQLLDLLFNNIISRICVPFFFIVSGYFVAKKAKQNEHYIANYIKGMLPIYLFWSMTYLPLGLGYIRSLGIPVYLFPIALLIGFIYSGTYYHLWYFPALFISLFCVRWWCKRFSIKSLLVLSFILLCLGASETYYGMLPRMMQDFIVTYYFNIFYTTRNFLFFGLFYVSLGYALGLKERVYCSYSFLKLVMSSILLVIEVNWLQSIERLDSNIMFACIPLVYSLFHFLLYAKELCRWHFHYSFRELSKYYYFIHPLLIYGFLAVNDVSDALSYGHLRALFMVVLVHACACGLIWLKHRFPKLPIG